MDAGLAKVINSTVGTDDFKPFDKIFTDNRSIVASDEKYFVFPTKLQDYTSEEVNASTKVNLFSFTLPMTGSCYLKYRFGSPYSDGSSYSYYLYFEVLKNNASYEKRQYSGSTNINSNSDESMILEGKAGDVFLIRIYPSEPTNKSRLQTRLYSINASIVREKPLSCEYFV